MNTYYLPKILFTRGVITLKKVVITLYQKNGLDTSNVHM